MSILPWVRIPLKSQLNRKWLEMLALIIPVWNSLFTIAFVKIRPIAAFVYMVIRFPLFIAGIIPQLKMYRNLDLFPYIEIK